MVGVDSSCSMEPYPGPPWWNLKGIFFRAPLPLMRQAWSHIITPASTAPQSRKGRVYKSMAMAAHTLFEKIWNDHVVRAEPDGTIAAVYRPPFGARSHLAAGFRRTDGRGPHPRRSAAALAVPDHNVPTTDRRVAICRSDQRQTNSKRWMITAKTFGITLFGMNDIRQAWSMSSVPEQGFTLPGMTIVCGDSTRQLTAPSERWRSASAPAKSNMCWQRNVWSRSARRRWKSVDGQLSPALFRERTSFWPSSADRHGRRNGLRHRYTPARHSGTQHGRPHDLCNMSIEGGARAGMVAPDETTFAYIKGRPINRRGPLGPGGGSLAKSPHRCRRDGTTVVELRAETIAPQVTWGTSPGMVTGVDGRAGSPAP